ncbi:hypothetical protein OH708_17340 [Pseudomonas capsici]|uniref:hypothetical protein n=1 Tax=Pseudomonas capsici TaxID=2810614 RepID=UPI0021F13E8D|nr:hypothetical protein [Pseudomonas capsici]MCV4289685.1 hypothetical protein [Pseudomonas capsici]
MMLAIAIDRDSVHAGDDLSSHTSSIKLDPTATLRALFEAIQTMYYLPGISGGEATWIICTSGKQIGVFAQQWPTPKLVVPIESLVKQVFGDSEPSLFFKYWCQTDPHVVFSRIEAGEILSSRY